MSDLLHDITKTAGRNKRPQRIGRGEGSKGKTSGRGQKGAGSRAGSSKRIGFEGGQTEVYRRFPQRGFSNKPFETKFHVVNLSALERFDDGATVDQRALKQAGLIPNANMAVKILGHGKLTKRLTLVAAAYSRSAHKAITEAGGSVQNVAGQPYTFQEPRTRRQSAKLDKRLAKLGLPAREKPPEEPAAPAEKSGKGKSPKAKKEPSARPTGESGDVTSAPESGTRDTAAEGRGKSASGDAVTDAPESGEQE
jgi:large subunit ribosomal protein L15